jgi:hypothetical protein
VRGQDKTTLANWDCVPNGSQIGIVFLAQQEEFVVCPASVTKGLPKAWIGCQVLFVKRPHTPKKKQGGATNYSLELRRTTAS